MSKNVIMPALGIAQETGRVLQWLKAEGDQIRQGEPLLEIETDKVTVELEAPASGVLLNVSARPGDDVPVGTVIASIWADEEVREASVAPTAPTPEGAPSWSQSRAATEPVSQAVSTLEGPGASSSMTAATGAARSRTETAGPPSYPRGRVPASPKARRLAAERGIDLRSVAGSGPGGAVVASNVLQAESSRKVQPEDRGAVSRIWRIMAERMAEAWRTIPHFYLLREVDAGRLVEWRESLHSRSGAPITYTDLLVKKVASTVRSHPHLNSEWRNGKIHLHSEINIGLAVAVEEGLVVPVIRDADKLTVPQIAAERSRLVEKAQRGKLSLEDISAGTFTISNLGMYGVDSFQAIVNPPQAALLAVGRIAQRVVPVDGQLVVRPMMTLSLSCDHRLVDGARAARFLGELADSLEQASPLEI